MIRHNQLLKKIFDTQYFAVLNSVGSGQPYSNLIAFAVTDDWKSLVFVTERTTHKYQNIRENERVALLLDNRTNQLSDIADAIAITLIGTAREASDGRSGLRDIFLKRHPQLEQFVNNPDNALILVNIDEYIIAGFDETKCIIVSQQL